MKLWFRLAVVVSIFGGWIALESSAVTSDVFQLNMFLKGTTQWSSLTNPAIQKVQIEEVDLINLGLGNPLGTPVPPNEKLALVKACADNDMRIIVYDTASTSNLVTIGEMPAVSTLRQVKHHERTLDIISQIAFHFAGSISNGLTGGGFLAAGKESLDTNDCMKTYHANIIGTLGASFFYTNVVYVHVVDLTVTNLTTNTYFVVSNFPVNVSSTDISSGKKLGSLIEP